MNLNNTTLEKVAVLPDQYPAPILQEIAMAGRSNVGKSSFINSVLGRRDLAHTSSQPGKTRTINFYNIDDKFRLVDLPGYGYARASVKDREQWAEYINTYLETRDTLIDIFLVVDFRHPPTKLDQQMYEYIQYYGYPGTVIATKADKVKRGQRDKNLKVLMETLGITDREKVVLYSSVDGNYKRRAWNKITELIE